MSIARTLAVLLYSIVVVEVKLTHVMAPMNPLEHLLLNIWYPINNERTTINCLCVYLI